MATVEDRVASGAYLLDLHAPGWREKINVDRLNVLSCQDCILGQVYGKYAEGMITLGIGDYCDYPEGHPAHQSMLGFAISLDTVDKDLLPGDSIYISGAVDAAFDRLREAWIQVLS